VSHFRNFVSLDELTENGRGLCGGIMFDPTMEAASLREECDEDVDFTAAQIVDWDDFAVTLATYVEREKASNRNSAALSRKYEGRNKFSVKVAGRGRKQALQNVKCKTCRAIFRPRRSTTTFCSPQCSHNSGPRGKYKSRAGHQPISAIEANLPGGALTTIC